MDALNRRDFLRATGAGLATLALRGKVLGANDRVRLAVCGLRGRGKDHIAGFSHLPNVEIAALCDVDETILNQRAGEMEKRGLPRPRSYVDVRKLLEDKDVDAVSVATPNHWHALMGIWTCQAGKDLYLEKPCSHNPWEGRQLVRAVKKYNRICQHGSQARSNPGMLQGIQRLREGLIGDVYLARGLCYKWRPTIGHAPQEPVPPGVHYDLWTGPAPLKPFTRNRFHYNWHWIWDTGNGDLGNQGIHEMDIARWGLGVGFPNCVSAMGGHFLFDDDQETPNILSATFYFDAPSTPSRANPARVGDPGPSTPSRANPARVGDPGLDGKRKMLEFEVRHWITNHEAEIGSGAYKSAGVPAAGLSPVAPQPRKAASAQKSLGPVDAKTNTIGNIFYGSKGYLAMDGYDAFKSWLSNQAEPGPSGKGDGNHWANFIACVRSRRADQIHAPIEEGHISATLVHLANVSYRLRRTLHFDPASEQVIDDEEANRMLRGTYRPPYVVPAEV